MRIDEKGYRSRINENKEVTAPVDAKSKLWAALAAERVTRCCD